MTCDCKDRGLKPLPKRLDALWHQLQELQQHPHYSATLSSPLLPEEEMIQYHVMIQLPRSWLADGRERHARTALAVVGDLVRRPLEEILGAEPATDDVAREGQ